MLGEWIRDISDNSDLGPKASPVCKEREAYTGVFIILSTLLSFPCYFRENHLQQLLPGNCKDNTCGLGSLRKSHGLRVQKVTAGPVVLVQLHHRVSLPRVHCQALKERVSQQLRAGTEARGSPEPGELPWRAGTEAFPVSTRLSTVVGRGHSTGTPQPVQY